MLTLSHILNMRSSLRLAAIATIATLTFTSPSTAQTYSTCNPTTQSGCPADPALGKSITVNFADGASDQFTAQGEPTYDSNGAKFTVAQSGQAPTLVSKWYIMFGKYSVTMKAAPGTGIVSSLVLQSDDLDEIDWEWLGGANDQVQSNYFGKGATTTYDRAAIHNVKNSQGEWHTYTVEWTETQIVWTIDDSTVRVLNANEANGRYPQTPMQLKLGSWAGGDPGNSEGTIAWAGGNVDYSAGPFSMYVSQVAIVDYSTGSKYTYGDQSGTWESIESEGGQVNGNSGGSVTVTDAPQITTTTSGYEGWSGTHDTHTATVSYTTLPGLPSGWTISGSGKVVPPSAAPSPSLSASSSPSQPVSAAVASCTGSGYKVVTSYNQQGFLTTATIAAGASTGWDDKGFPTTVYPANCMVSNPPIAAGEVLKVVATTRTGLVTLSTADSTALITQHVSHNSGASRIPPSWVAASCTAFVALASGFLLL
ncbi:putative extracellular glycosidase [Pseudocercospora fuligena]|uniref:chitinase n=1 Tax=Pseudocercospora fuligena TaxID=685502 RepID=A0A8H6R760_9PEZI|nr:putative extracellular glycosidase [Pseudocercospora fuligena]